VSRELQNASISGLVYTIPPGFRVFPALGYISLRAQNLRLGIVMKTSFETRVQEWC